MSDKQRDVRHREVRKPFTGTLEIIKMDVSGKNTYYTTLMYYNEVSEVKIYVVQD